MSGSFARTTPHHSTRQSPPDYSSRRVKLRLFVTLASIMLVAALVERTLTTTKQPPAQRSETFNNRLPSEPRTSGDPAGTFVAVSDPKSDAVARENPFDPVDRAVSQGWKELFTRLNTDDRDLLFELLAAARQERQFSPEKMALSADLLTRLSKSWSDYQASALQSLTDINEADKPKWNDVLQQADSRFDESLMPLNALAGGHQMDDRGESAFATLESTLVAIARSQIQDDTPILRPAERQAWLYEFSQASDLPTDQAIHDKAAHVGYLQLSRQATDYRGKLVTIAGNVRRAYRSAASPNYLGIKEYCVYWLYPAGGPDTPIVVYALDVPVGFPKLAKNLQDARNNLREDVKITGIFFKRCAYAAQGGTYTAPLILANTPVWHPAPPPFSATPSPTLTYELGGATLVALVIALCITSILWKRSSSRRIRAQSLSDTSLVDLSKFTTSPTATDHLRQLENREGGGT